MTVSPEIRLEKMQKSFRQAMQFNKEREDNLKSIILNVCNLRKNGIMCGHSDCEGVFCKEENCPLIQGVIVG